MNKRHIQYVQTILREGSITAASKKLYLTQPSLSQTIRLIERDLGAPILNRSTIPISLTEAGRKYMEAANQMIDIDRKLHEEIRLLKETTHKSTFVPQRRQHIQKQNVSAN